MTDSAQLTHEVLLRVAEFLRKLPTDQLDDLAAGTARLEVVAKPSGRRLPARAATAPVSLPRPVDEISAALSALVDRAAAARYLDDLHLRVGSSDRLPPPSAAVASKATKAQARDTIVQWTVGRRADAKILSRPGAPRRP